MCSCIVKFTETFVPEEVKKIIMFSDNCSGWNKNITLLMFCLIFIHSGHFSEITMVYFKFGHTYMAADCNFAIIEKNRRCYNNVFTPDEHIDIIKNFKRAGERRVPF